MTWSCAQLEQRLDDYLEGRLSAEDAAAAQAHVDTCARCAEWADAQQATLWLREMESLETPPGFETRIIALTTAPAPQESFWSVFDLAWRGLLQPRVALSLAAALVSLGLTFQALNVPVGELSLADLSPVNIYYAVNRQAQLGYARGVRFVNDLRLVYEIRSRLEELRGQPEETPAAAPVAEPGQSGQPKKDEQNRKRENFSDGAHAQWLLASTYFRVPGELR